MLFAKKLEWHEGVLVLNTNEVLVGEITVESYYDLVLFKTNNIVSVYPAHKIKSFRYYDEVKDLHRRFVTVCDQSYNHNASHFYEIVIQGEWCVLRKQKQFLFNTELSDRNDYTYFTLSDEQLVPLMLFRQKVYPQLIQNSGQRIVDFVDKEKLNPNEAASAIQIIQFYHKLTKYAIVALK